MKKRITIPNSGDSSATFQRGSAALEALMILTFFIVPLWMLMFNAGYLGLRMQRAQMATSLAAYGVQDEVMAGNTNFTDGVRASVGSAVFPGNPGTLKQVKDDPDPQSAPRDDQLGRDKFPDDIFSKIMAAATGHREVTVTVARRSPYRMFTPSDVKIRRTVGGTPYVYCEQGGDLTKLGLSADSILQDAASVVLSLGNIFMAPYGGYPPGADKC
mgnify:CR=1 FL=1